MTRPPPSLVRSAELIREAAVLMAAGDRNNACVITIPIPTNFAKKFPDGAMHNHGHEPHLTVLFVSPDVSPGTASKLLSLLRIALREFSPFRMQVDARTGLKDFGPNEEKGEKALWVPARSDPRGELERLNRVIKTALVRAGIEVEAHNDFVPHVTWAYVPNDISEKERQRQEALAASQLGDFWFDVRHVVLSLPQGDRPIMLKPILRR